MTSWFRSRLQFKVTSTMLLGAFVPLVALGLLSVFTLNYFHKLDLEQIEKILIDQTSASINASLGRVTETFQVQTTFDQATDISIEDQHLLLKQLFLQFPELEEASFLSGSEGIYGQETSLYRRSTESFADSEDLLNQSNLDKFKQAISGVSYIGPVYHTLKGPMVTVAEPVKNTPKAGVPQVIGVLTGEVRLTALTRTISQTQLGNAGYVYVLDNNGYLLAQSAHATPVGTYIPTKPKPELSTYSTFWGGKAVGLGVHLSKLNATLVAEWPVEDANQVVNTVMRQMILASLLVFGLALFLSFYLALRIVRPIKLLESSTIRIASGKFDQQVTIQTNDELEQLGIAFNKMQDGLKRLEELKEEFVFVASHELRTPVTAIKGYLSMIMQGEAGPLSNDVKNLLTQVNTANDRLIQLVEDLLEVARSEAGRLTIEVVPLDIKGVIDSVILELAPLAKQKQIQLSYSPTTAVPLVNADVARLKEVLINLVGNAIKYTKGSGAVTITHELQKRNLITRVTDQGIGISAQEQEKLFEKFYRVKNTDTKNIQGTGLGLFIVKQIVEKMNGKIGLTSETGKGSTFWFSLGIPSAKKRS